MNAIDFAAPRTAAPAASLFGRMLRGQIIFNTCWEDPALDRAALELRPSHRVLVITSAGCNALDYLLGGAGEVDAVDLNPCQNALLELKVAGILGLEYPDFFRLFGEGGAPDARRLYEGALRARLSPEARGYWDRQIGIFDGTGWRESFYYHGASGLFAKLAVQAVHGIHKLRGPVERLLAAASVDQQRRIYEDSIRDRLWTPWLCWALSRGLTLNLLGVPPAQHETMRARYPRGAADYIRDCFETVVTRLPLKDNYFWRVYMTGRYTADCCPEYLKEENFGRLRDRVRDLRIRTATLERHLRGDSRGYARFVLLDHMDWFCGPLRQALADEWEAILLRAEPGARAIYRSAALDASFLKSLPVRFHGRTELLGTLLRHRSELAERLHARDRVHTYGSFHIADLPG
jgi:S-adenosylmethionine-diacylglycerol 3-amino-3-carboxypropyl transferase